MSNNQRKNEDLDRIYCQSISKSISNVIRFSLDESFRKNCFEVFGVSCTADTEKEIYKKLMTLIESKSIKKNRDIEDGIFTEVDPLDQLPDTSASKVNETQTKNANTNWLQISSQQFRECIKRKRICFYSQPQNRKDFLSRKNYQPNCKVLTSFKSNNSNMES